MTFVKPRLLITAICLLAPLHLQAAKLDYRIATWNLEWLTEQPVERIDASKRTNQDIAKLSDYAQQLDADIIAFQEVESVALAEKVFGSQYQIYLSDRAQNQFRQNQFDSGNQYTGFAVKRGIEVKDLGDIRLESSHSSHLRFASYLVIAPQSDTPIHALAVHLKAGCSGAYKDSRECAKLSEQGKHLQSWIQDQQSAHHQYLIMGDFNHNLAYRGDWLWNIITSGSNAKLLTQQTQAKCKVRSNNNPAKLHQFRSLIDHIIISGELASQTQATQLTYQSQDVLKYQLSDHCPVYSQLN
ncbi:Metal-dependent hydrolase, endonuclease/exonuclease/phosphatase family [Vibrio xiamenensis]|uniref:Metal-dependent hydrolase, endonuclease/exonuclease/phosphatase family n=1 Tax=Vibrio xiamenensis TaxID=861298 RepID=A0A1G7YXU6_9VIBR|nr:endonuclease/exonuclease/phosphatase family protein [Vibrio xiamenensis]SDH01086.1 Metal-dependent hydrolase, endonuclease/exonuclease/phosphatase family [Vibrio xiamenensis]